MSVSTPSADIPRTSTVDFEDQIKLAMALSASEAEHHRRLRNERFSEASTQRGMDNQEEEDRLLALLLQAADSGPSGSTPTPEPRGFGRNGGQSQVSTSQGGRKVCAGCGQALTSGFIQALGKNWHPGCFKCGGCGKPIESAFIRKDGEAYHQHCHAALFQEKCSVCHNAFSEQVVCYHPFWKEKYCQLHNQDGTKRCTACERLQSRGSDWLTLEDGRHLCTNCQESIVVDTKDCQPLYEEIRLMYCDLGLPFNEKPPLGLVDQSALNDYTAKEGSHGGAQSQTRGMTLTEEYRSIHRMVRRRGSRWKVLPEVVPIEKKHCSVTAVLVLYGLPRLVTGSILAHEMMHVWLKLNNITGLTPFVEEGLCQLMALLWLERQEVKDAFEKRLASFIGNQIRTHSSPIYGGGFRAAHESFQSYNLHSLVDHVKLTGAFPVPQKH